MKTLTQIAASLPGYQPDDLHTDHVSAFLAHLAQALALTPAHDAHDAPLPQALGRVLACDVVSPISVPPHDNSAMDGYAFDGRALQPGQPLTLRVVGAALAGQPWSGTAGAGECVRIMTGAVMPEGLDTVAPHEQTIATAPAPHTGPHGKSITLPADTLRRGDNRRLRGEDLRQGAVALPAGTRITPAALGLLASLGLPQAPVLRRLRVATLSTGDEILNLGEPPRPGAVYDSNRYTLLGLLTQLGCEVIDLGAVRDEPTALRAALERAAQEADVVLTSGGAGMGDADHTRTLVQSLGEVAFWRIAMRPGRPMVVGLLDKKSPPSAQQTRADSYQKQSKPALFLGLPGNPVAAMVVFLALVRPALLRLMGCAPKHLPLLRATASQALRKRPGRTEYQRGTANRAPDGTLHVRSTGNQGSGVLSSMVQANCLIVLAHDQGPVAVGDGVDVMLFDGVM